MKSNAASLVSTANVSCEDSRACQCMASYSFRSPYR